MMHDPFQTYTTLGSYYGIPTQMGFQHPQFQNAGINPAAAFNPLFGLPQAGGQQLGQSPFGQGAGLGFINPQQLQQQQWQQQQLQLASLLASQGAFQNPLLASLLSNPLIAASLHSPFAGYGGPQLGQQQQLHPQIGQFPQMGQMGSPFGQMGSHFGQGGYPLAPQSWIGQGGPLGAGQGFGQIHPFQSQLTQRPFQAQGFSPWGY